MNTGMPDGKGCNVVILSDISFFSVRNQLVKILEAMTLLPGFF